MIKNLLKLLIFVNICFLAASFLVNVPEAEWKTEVIAEDTYGKFVSIDSYENKLGVAYVDSINSGLSFLEHDYSNSPLDLIKIENKTWKKQKIDGRKGRGMYPSLRWKKESPAIAYQDGRLGQEKLYFAQRNQAEWQIEEVDNVSNGGVSVGMYNSMAYLENPVIFYHSPSQGLKKAERKNNWTTERLESDMGWFTSSSECEGKILAAYSGRTSDSLMIGEYPNWSSENTSINVRSDISMDTRNCKPHFIYLEDDSGNITYMSPSGQKKILDNGFFSRMSIEAEENIHLIYHKEGTGLKYFKKDAEWSNRTVAEGSDLGRYNDIEVDSSGNIHTAYLNQTTLYHAVYNSGQIEFKKQALDNLRIITGLSALTPAFILLIIIYGRGDNPKSKILSLKEKIKPGN
jgi:hypothetical protein